MINIIFYVVLAISMGVIVFLGAFVGRMQATTLWVGKKIAPKGLDQELPRGFQDAITPKMQDIFNTILPIAYIVVLIVGTIKIWYLGVLLLFISILLTSVAQRLYPNNINVYLNMIITAMMNKLADYTRDKDEMRADAARDMVESLQNFYLKIKDLKMKVPRIIEAKKMLLGD